MTKKLYPLKFEPLYQYRVWGGRNLEKLLSKPLPPKDPIGEAWILSDRKDHASKVTEGPLKGTTLPELMKRYSAEIMGSGKNFERFPLLLKFLDCKKVLSVQVHPSDDQKEYIPAGDTGKTEAWVVIDTEKEGKIYAGLKKDTTKKSLKEAIQNKNIADQLHYFKPQKGDAVLIQSGTVHTLGGALVFEVQENSDTTYRLYDWDRTDPKTGKPRKLQIEKALACIDYNQQELEPVTPQPDAEHEEAEKLFDDSHFKVWRFQTDKKFTVGRKERPTVLVALNGRGEIAYNQSGYALQKGEVMVLPAMLGKLNLHPQSEITMLEITIPEHQ